MPQSSLLPGTGRKVCGGLVVVVVVVVVVCKPILVFSLGFDQAEQQMTFSFG